MSHPKMADIFKMMCTSTVRPYIDLIKHALPQVGPGYFILTTTYEPSGIVRERVFCYELYHQLRKIMTTNLDLTLNGEIDKRGHIDFAQNDQKNPDFVFHIPGTHEGNTLVIEVKGKLNPCVDIKKDFNTITTFIEKYGYIAGIFVLYNHSLSELKQTAGQVLRRFMTRPSANSIHILTIEQPEGDCEELLLSELNQQGTFEFGNIRANP